MKPEKNNTKQMKNTDIHIGLPEKELRDYFSESLRICSVTTDNIIKNYKWDKDKPYENTIENLKLELIRIQSELKRFESLRSIYQLLKLKGWSENDCSDYVTRIDDKGSLNFIGTEEEFFKIFKINENS